MKLKNIFLFLLLSSHYFVSANKPNVYVLPLYIFLIEPSDGAAAQVGGMAGIGSSALALVTLRNPKKVLGDQLFSTLDAIEKKLSHEFKAFWQGKEAPEYIYKSLQGTANLWEIVKQNSKILAVIKLRLI